MIVESLYGYLTASSTIATLLGVPRSDKTTGIFPSFAPDGAPMPQIVIMQVVGQPLQESFQGTGRLQSARFRFSCYGSTYKSAKVLANAVKQAMMSCDGTMSSGNCEVHGSWFRLEQDEAEPIPHGTVYSTHVDFEVNFLDFS
jgi:hypothetical protein